jgi:hypothetical protein
MSFPKNSDRNMITLSQQETQQFFSQMPTVKLHDQ